MKMSKETGTPKSARGGPGTVLGRVAVGVLLSAPVAAVAATAGPAPAAPEQVAMGCPGPELSTIREQFEASFTPGAVAPASKVQPIICDR
jgi:hypothetical protein